MVGPGESIIEAADKTQSKLVGDAVKIEEVQRSVVEAETAGALTCGAEIAKIAAY